MNVFLCITDTGSKRAVNFVTKIISIVDDCNVFVCRSFKDLETVLRTPWELHDVAILFAGNNDELEKYISLQDLLEGLSIILVLSDRAEEVGLLAHSLRPRFITYEDSEVSNIAAVLKKMIKNQQNYRMVTGRLPLSEENTGFGNLLDHRES